MEIRAQAPRPDQGRSLWQQTGDQYARNTLGIEYVKGVSQGRARVPSLLIPSVFSRKKQIELAPDPFPQQTGQRFQFLAEGRRRHRSRGALELFQQAIDLA